jgi:prepilin-type N-terminal cleavage/methylation domain-containing protein
MQRIKDTIDAEGGRDRRASGGRSGFTLMELLVVLAVIAVLMGILFPAIQGAIERARITRARTEAQALQQAWLSYWNAYYDPNNDTFNWPGFNLMNAAAVAVLSGENTTLNPLGIVFMEFDDIHLADGFKDPWGNLYRIALGTTVDEAPEWVYETRAYFGNVARDRY